MERQSKSKANNNQKPSLSEQLESWYKANKGDLDLAFKNANIPPWQLLNFGDKIQVHNYLYKLGEYSIEEAPSIKKIVLH